MVRRLHQRRARSALRDLLGRTAHINVDDPRALRFNHPRGFGHGCRFAPRDLNGSAFDADPQLRLFARAGSTRQQLVTGDHFRHDQTATRLR